MTMKKIKNLLLFSTLILFSVSNAFGQQEKFNNKVTPKLPIDNSINKITYSEVVYVDSLANKEQLFSRAREWFAKAYKSSTNVIQMEDKESGKIVGKALMKVYHKALGLTYPSGYINYTISIYLKDGRYPRWCAIVSRSLPNSFVTSEFPVQSPAGARLYRVLFPILL